MSMTERPKRYGRIIGWIVTPDEYRLSILDSFKRWLSSLDDDSPFWKAYRSENARRSQALRKTHSHGGGRPKGTTNKPGHRAGRPRKTGAEPSARKRRKGLGR